MTDVADRFRSAATRFTTAVEAVDAGQWSASSRCADWTIADVVAHVAATEHDFLAQREVSAPDIAGLEPPAAWGLMRDAVADVLADPERAHQSYDGYFGPTTIAETIDRFYTMDLIVHRWDIAHALGLDDLASFDDGELAHLRWCVDGLPEGVLRSSGVFGPAVEPPAGASDQDRLLAFMGRTP